ncbi:ATP-binding protein [Sphingobium cloacae]|uniref:histidine kinase n=1 Tax=Sphingobium cloacae TaxID=120107 RepID=A0A1E1EZC0_9SPHN|nr:ATP-binding protein [Sphingobium cloacae]BAV63600.1 putative two-component histidine kinase [Sphingobium cloacae]
MRPLRSIGMVGRIALVVAAAVLLELCGNIALHRWQEAELVPASQIRRISARLVEAERAAIVHHPRDRGRTMHELAGDGMTLNWVARTVITDFGAYTTRLGQLREAMIGGEPGLAARELRLTLIPSAEPGKRDLLGARQLVDGSFVTFRIGPYLDAPPHPATVVAMHLLLTLGVLLIAVLMVRALVQPLRNLAEAADATGHGRKGSFRIEGPPEVRRVAAAFSAMQARLVQTMEDHTQSLISVSHDLRTPIQRLHLRAALIDDPEAREALAVDLGEMEHFIESTLSYFRSGDEEPLRRIDLAAIAMTAVDTASDLGADIRYEGPDAFETMARPLAMKRVIANLIDNARRHADRIVLTLRSVDHGGFEMDVDDDGPGIPADLRAEAVLPFRRLEQAPGQGHGGAGLGLAAVDRAMAAMGGRLILTDSPLGGLKARLVVQAS